MIWVVSLQCRCSLPSYEIASFQILHQMGWTQNDPYPSSKSAKQNHLSKDANIPRGYREGSSRHESLQQKLVNRKIKQDPLESITRVIQCGAKITDFSSVPNTKSWTQLKISFQQRKEAMLQLLQEGWLYNKMYI